MKTTIEMIESKVFVARDEQGNKTAIDMREKEDKRTSSPMEMVLSALGACVGVDIAIILEKRRKNISHFSIEVEGTRRSESPKAFTEIHCVYSVTSPDVQEEELHKIAKMALEKYCSVAASLKAKITFSVKVEQ